MNLRYAMILAAFLAGSTLFSGVATFDKTLKLRASAPGGAFCDGETLRFELVNGTPRPDAFTVKNWRGDAVRSGEWPSDGSPLELQTLPHGHYRLETSSGNIAFAVLPAPAERQLPRDSFFALDTHFSWSREANLEAGYGDGERGFDFVAELARRAGVAAVRDRIVWASRNPAPGTFDFGYYTMAVDRAHRRNLDVMNVYHNAPDWTIADDPRKNHLRRRLPDDLIANYEYNKKLAETFRGKIGFWEFWNEQDHGFSEEAAWDYAANMKAAYLGFKAGDPAVTVLSGGYCTNDPKRFFAASLKSDLPQYFDIVNYHNYMPRAGYPKLIGEIRSVMKEAGAPDMPIWFSEIGTYVEGNGKEPSLKKDLLEHSYDQELAVGREIPKILLTIQQLGVDRAFWYNMMPNNEQQGRKSWGLIRRDYTVKASYTAFAVMTGQLAAARLLGTVRCDKEVTACLFRQPDGTQTLFVYREKGQGPFRIPGVTPRTRGVDFLGSELKITNGSIPLDESPVYLNNLAGLRPDAPAAPTGSPGAIERGMDKTVVLKVTFPRSVVLSRHRDEVDFPHGPQRITLDIFNFSDRVKTGIITVDGAEFIPDEQDVTIPAMGKATLNGTLTARALSGKGGTIVFGGVFGGMPITRLAVPFIQSNPAAGCYREKPLPDMMRPDQWRKNASGKLEITEIPAENALKFQVAFPPKVDRWAYPVYQLKLPQESFKDAVGFAVEIKALKSGINLWNFRLNLRGEKFSGGGEFYALPSGDWEERRYFFTDKDKPEKALRVELGFNPGSEDFGWMIRNPRLLYRK